MKVTTVVYHKTFNLGNYCSEKIGVEIELDENDTVEMAFEAAKKSVVGFHVSSNPIHLVSEEVIENKPELPSTTSIIDSINSCSKIKVLETYRLIAKSNPEYQQAYDNQLKKLQ
jgi:hypothetical protein